MSMSILLAAGEGGHDTQLSRLKRIFDDDGHRTLVIREGIKAVSKESNDSSSLYFNRSLSKFSKYHSFKGRFVTLVLVAVVFLRSLRFLYRARPDIIVLHGPLFCLPIFFAAKFYRLNIVFIESWSKFERPSKTGLFLRDKVDLVLFQNIELSKFYPKGIYAGRL